MQVTVLNDATVVAFEDCASPQEVEYVALRHALIMLPREADPARFIDEVYTAVQDYLVKGEPVVVHCAPVSVAIDRDSPGC